MCSCSLAHLLQVEDLVLHFLQRSEQFGLAQPRLLQLGLQVGHERLCVLKQTSQRISGCEFCHELLYLFLFLFSFVPSAEKPNSKLSIEGRHRHQEWERVTFGGRKQEFCSNTLAAATKQKRVVALFLISVTNKSRTSITTCCFNPGQGHRQLVCMRKQNGNCSKFFVFYEA